MAKALPTDISAVSPESRILNPESSRLPQHVAIIMDGNGRWAKARGLPRISGHKKGADTLRCIMNNCRDAHVHYLTIYAFSSENWKRPSDEISDLMKLLRHYIQQELATLIKDKVRMRFIGDLSQIEPRTRKMVEDAIESTRYNTDFHLTVALSYGSRQEIVRATRALAKRVEAGILKADDIDEALLNKTLDTSDMPEPDLLIRTGGEQRMSNFLLWQSAYTELYFTPTLWPDFNAQHFTAALQDYAKRERRYGTTGE